MVAGRSTLAVDARAPSGDSCVVAENRDLRGSDGSHALCC